ncbi:MAG: hypothetical protein EBU08_05485 [Micrococcales bacterium]|jgi:hypothetical protein|nr:hypothetical protein [Micrococcales bacterium]
MSFESMKLEELRGVADGFGVDLDSAKTKKQILNLLEEEGVTFDLYQKFFSAEKDDAEEYVDDAQIRNQRLNLPDPNEEVMLVKMDRQNGLYETAGFTFTRDHPYVAMAPWQAQVIFDNETGFRPATPKEIQEYYS